MKPITTEDVQSAQAMANILRKTMYCIGDDAITDIDLITNLKKAAHFLERTFFYRTSSKSSIHEDIFSNAESDLPENVQEWISHTFTRQNSATKQKRSRLRSLVNAVSAGLYFERAFRRISLTTDLQIPSVAVNYMKENIDKWEFDMFVFNEHCVKHPLKVIGYELLHRNNMLTKYRIEIPPLEAFLDVMEKGYSLHNNPYHNLIHAADVAQTCNILIVKSKLITWMSDLEVLSIFVAAIIHDYEHTGTTNNFHIATRSELAMIYNDKSVLESYHISTCFTLLQQSKYNFLKNLAKEEYKEFRSLVIEMVLSTDMTVHFSQVQNMKDAIMLPENLQKINIMSFVLHSADISHASKPWNLHRQWTEYVTEEFFRQGDREKESGLPCSPLCDRQTTFVPESQIGFINFIVDPCFQVLSDMFDAIVILFPVTDSATEQRSDLNESRPQNPTPSKLAITDKPWFSNLYDNKSNWLMMSQEFKQLNAIKEESGSAN